MENKNHSHQLLWICILICILSIAILSYFTYTGGTNHVFNSELNTYFIKAESFYGIMATFIGICATIMLGSQIYSIYSRTQVEKEYDGKLREVREWFSASTKKYDQELADLSKANRSFEKLKYLINDALARIHYSDNKKMEGIVDVMENIYTLINNADVFENDYCEKLDFACYSIIKNLKEYADDISYKSADIKTLCKIQDRWNKRFNQINFDLAPAKYIEIKLKKINKVLNSIFDNFAENHCHEKMSLDDWKILCELIRNKA